MLRSALYRNRAALKLVPIETNQISQSPEKVSIEDDTAKSTVDDCNSKITSNLPTFDSILENLPNETENNEDIEDILDGISNTHSSNSTRHVQFKEDVRQFNDDEEYAYFMAKRNTGLLYITHFLPLTIFLWKSVRKEEFSAISSSAFEGWLSKKKTKDISSLTAEAVKNEPRHPPGTIGTMQKEIATTTIRSELSKL